MMTPRLKFFMVALTLGGLVAACGNISTPVASPGGPWYADPAGDDANDCLSAATACATIQAAIDKADPGGTVIAAVGTYPENLQISKAIVLQGAGIADTIIDAMGTGRAMAINQSVVEIDGLTVQNGSVNTSGGNITHAVGDLTMSNVRVLMGSADNGGGIFNSGVIAMSNVEITGNTAERGGGIMNASTGLITATNVQLEGNSGSQAGGGIFNAGEFELSDATVSSNMAEGDGGGIFNAAGASFDVNATDLIGNVASRGYSGGGFFNLGQFDLIESQVGQNSAEAYGGGGVNAGTLSALNSDFEANSAEIFGGGLFNDADASEGLVLTVTGGEFTGNSAHDGGGLYNDGNAEFVGTTFDDNEGETGGAVYNHGDRIDLTNVSITNNRATAKGKGAGGGGIVNIGLSARVVLTDSLVEGNDAGVSGGELVEGGGLFSRWGTVIVAGTEFRDNTASGGGGIAVDRTTFELHSSTVADNHAYLRAGGVSIYTSPYGQAETALVRRSTISGNSSDGIAGGLYNRRVELTVDDTTIGDNTSIDDGAGIHVDRGDFYRTTLSGNISNKSGGGLLVRNGHSVKMTNVTVSGNQAQFGGGGFVRRGDLELRYATIANNQTTNGAALVVSSRDGSALARVIGSLLADNSGENCGGFIIDSLAANLSDDDSCPFSEPTDQQNATANLGPLQNNGGMTETHGLGVGSQAINTDVCHSINQDQRGDPRPKGSLCDTGSFEWELLLIEVGPTSETAICEAAGNLEEAEITSISLREASGVLVQLTLPDPPPEGEHPAQLAEMDGRCTTDADFPNRLFCLMPDVPGGGEVLFRLFVPECAEPTVFEEPIVAPARPTPEPTDEPAPEVTPERTPGMFGG